MSNSRSNSPTDESIVAFEEEDIDDYAPGGYHPVRLGDTFHDQYTVVRKLGYGQHSTVWLALDTRSNRHVALKILTSRCYGGKKEVYELAILQCITSSDPRHPGYRHVLGLLDHFVHVGPHGKHVCLVHEVMCRNLHEFSFHFEYQQLPLDLVREVARQMLWGLDYLHTVCSVIHTDLKPANILISVKGCDIEQEIKEHLEKKQADVFGPDYLMASEAVHLELPDSPSEFEFKIADFASWIDDHLMELIQPIDLRAPEVVLGVEWDTSADIWNAGCVIFELLQGRALFRGRADEHLGWSANEDRLALMMDLFGPLPADLIRDGKKSSRYFDREGNLSSIRKISNDFSLAKLSKLWNPDLSERDACAFASFLEPMLKYRPRDRKTAAEMLKEAWIQ